MLLLSSAMKCVRMRNQLGYISRYQGRCLPGSVGRGRGDRTQHRPFQNHNNFSSEVGNGIVGKDDHFQNNNTFNAREK
jgi:hypothetical protein